MTEKLTSGLWDFALEFYQGERQRLLLQLQNEADMDVLLVAAYFWARAGHRGWPTAGQLQPYLQWRAEMIAPLRTLRKKLALDMQPLRRELLAAELSAERYGVQLIEAGWGGEPLPASVLAVDFMYYQRRILPQAVELWVQLEALAAPS